MADEYGTRKTEVIEQRGQVAPKLRERDRSTSIDAARTMATRIPREHTMAARQPSRDWPPVPV